MRRILTASVLIAGFSGAAEVPFHLGVPMVYDVWRGYGASHSAVTILPLDSTFEPSRTVWDTSGLSITGTIIPARTLWKLAVRDSLREGARRTSDTMSLFPPSRSSSEPAVLLDTIALQVTDTARTWVAPSCLVPWDLEPYQENPFPFGARWGHGSIEASWGGLSLLCSMGPGAYTSRAGATSASIRTYLTTGSVVGTGENRTLGLPHGYWSPDSGWLGLDDPDAGTLWKLRSIGKGSQEVPPERFSRDWTRRWQAGLSWIWVRYDRQGPNVQVKLDSSYIRWTVLGRSSDSSRFQRWRLEASYPGRRSDTLTVTLDTLTTPQPPTLATSLADLPIHALRQTAKAFGGPSTPFTSGRWMDGGATTRWGVEPSRTGSFRIASDTGLVEWTSCLHTRTNSQTYDTCVTFALYSFDGIFRAATPERASHGHDRLDLRKLDRLSVEGSTSLEITDLAGQRIALPGGTRPSDALASRHGILVVRWRLLSGISQTGRLLLP